MSLGTILYRILIGPLELFFEVVFAIAERHVDNPALAIIFLSLAMNFLVLPLYRRADAVQAEERDRENALAPWIRHIKKTFKGDERFMMLQAFYRENNYKPTDSLKGSVSLLLEIPFFIAAYHFLSNLQTLKGVSFGPIADLGSPDGLLTVGTVTLNCLPILMTLINVISAAIYMKGFPIKSKIQMYGIAAIFLVFLYKSPAGLVFYWTLNNLFSLLKNIFYKLPDSGKILKFAASCIGFALLIYVFFINPMPSMRTQIIVVFTLLFFQAPLLINIMKRHNVVLHLPGKKLPRNLYYASCLLLAVLTGLLIPSAVMNGSVEEFIDISAYISPAWYLLSTFSIAAGSFVIWLGVFYKLASDVGKCLMNTMMAIIAIVGIMDYMFFGRNYGNFSSDFQFDNALSIGGEKILINTLAIIIVAAAVLLIDKKKPAVISIMVTVSCLAIIGMTAINTIGIVRELKNSSSVISIAEQNKPEIKLSKNGKNVVVIMMDRQIGHLIPFIIHEKPELKEQFDGFTYYSNTVSFGNKTNFGSPALYGGYDYTPEKMNERDKESLESKHNEALKVMPTLFDKEGYKITICEPTYAGYSWIPDLSVFDDHPEWYCFLADRGLSLDEFGYKSSSEADRESRFRNFFCYSLFKISPLLFQRTLYAHGSYNAAKETADAIFPQTLESQSKATGFKKDFMKTFAFLYHLPEITKTEKSDQNAFFMMSNDTTHDTMLLQEPEYVPSLIVDNTEYDKANTVRKDDEGNELAIKNGVEAYHYQVNMAAMLQLGKWMDHLRDLGVYDNTRIIIVSDHGQDIAGEMDKDYLLTYKNKDGDIIDRDVMAFNCALLMKDFDSKGFSTKEEMATNADVPFLATEGIVENAKNPFTGSPLTTYQKTPVELNLLYSMKWDISENNGNKFLEAEWYRVRDNIYDIQNWQYTGFR